ncbi:MAG: prepilin-type N-terminal cleavage/methylation domain-containing protein [Phycisphaeraceae bacterium]|nr:prepilin-type N-terminal cleavage/methylation domain-containing protein [Phycisphaeraceae bacterium]
MTSEPRRDRLRAFTLVELLIVILILGILAAIVVPSFFGATEEARQETTRHELLKLRRAVEVYMTRHSNGLPGVLAGDGTWGEIVMDGEYLSGPPTNAWVGEVTGREIVIGDEPDGAYHTDYGWIFDDTTGDIWAASFDENDEPLPKP